LEEQIKAHLLTKQSGNDWKTQIENTEKHLCFSGQIGFVLEFAGIIDYYERNNNCSWTEQEDMEFFNSLKNYANKAIAVFKDKKSYNSKFEWERAVLTKGDYLIEASSSRKNLLTTDRNTRDFSWKRLFRINDEHKSKRQFVKQVFADVLFDENNLQNSLEKICKNKTYTWRDYLIACPNLIRDCGQGFIRFENEHRIFLLGQSQMNHWHSEMYTLFLWYNHFENNHDLFSPFKSEYHYSKSYDDEAYIVLNVFCHNRICYDIYIRYDNNDKLPHPYEITFRKTKGDNTPERYRDDVKNILANLSFECNEDYSGFFYRCNESSDLIENLKRLCEKLRRNY
jgi:hypothetical protein